MIRLLVAAEDATGNWTARHVADLHIQQVAWVADAGLEHVREWMLFDGRPWLSAKRASELLSERFRGGFFTARGHFGGEPGAADSLAFRKLFHAIEAIGPPDVLIVARDVDATDRRRGFEQARCDRPWSFAVAGALADPEAEAWLICTATASTDPHRRCIAELRQELGLDPIRASHRLTSTSDSPKDAKGVRRRLEAAGMDLETSFRERGVADLRACGEDNGLARYIEDLDASLMPRLRTHHG